MADRSIEPSEGTAGVSAGRTAIPLPEGLVVVRCHWCSNTAVCSDVDITRPGVKAHRTPRVALCAEHLVMVDRSFGEFEFERQERLRERRPRR